MRPDIDAGPIGRKWSASNGPSPDRADGAGGCAERTTSDWPPTAAARMSASVMKRRSFMAETLLQKFMDLAVDEVVVGRVAAAAGRVAPQRRNGDELHAGDELAFVARVAGRKIEIGFAGHVQHGHPNRPQRALMIAVEP